MSNNQASEDAAGRGGEARAGRLAAALYTGTAFILGLAFWAVTTFTGSYSAVARFGGAIWVFILVMIVLMPIVIPRVRNRKKPKKHD